MTLTLGRQRAVAAVFFAVLIPFYGIAWLSPAFGLFHDDGGYLVTARAFAAGHAALQSTYPPLFPALLALFAGVSGNIQWLKALPLLSTVGWLAITHRLLTKMGASWGGAIVMVWFTAASPMVLFLSTNLLPDSLFALLVTACLLALIDDRPLSAGLLAGLSVLARNAGIPLIVAGLVVLLLRRRLNSAALFAATAMIPAAPWLGWSLAVAPHDYSTLNILTALPANEKLVVITRNFAMLMSSPAWLTTGFGNMYATIGIELLAIYCLYRRRQLVPDLFIALYGVMLLCVIWPPERFVAPVLPLGLWLLWRVIGDTRKREALTACLVILAGLAIWANVRDLPKAGGQAGNRWTEMTRLFAFIRASTPPDAVLLANLDPVFSLNTGRRTIRGFSAPAFGLHYAAPQTGVTPDQLSIAIRRDDVRYVAVTPDRDRAESESFHRSVEALERGGVLQPVVIEGLSPEYRLLQVTR